MPADITNSSRRHEPANSRRRPTAMRSQGGSPANTGSPAAPRQRTLARSLTRLRPHQLPTATASTVLRPDARRFPPTKAVILLCPHRLSSRRRQVRARRQPVPRVRRQAIPTAAMWARTRLGLRPGRPTAAARRDMAGTRLEQVVTSGARTSKLPCPAWPLPLRNFPPIAGIRNCRPHRDHRPRTWMSRDRCPAQPRQEPDTAMAAFRSRALGIQTGSLLRPTTCRSRTRSGRTTLRRTAMRDPIHTDGTRMAAIRNTAASAAEALAGPPA